MRYAAAVAALVFAAWLQFGRKPAAPPADPRKLAAAYLDGTLRPLLERFDGTGEFICKQAELEAYGETRVGVVGADLLKSALTGEKVLHPFHFGWFPLPVLPVDQLTPPQLAGIARGVEEARGLRLVALYRIEQARWPVARGKSQTDITGYTSGELSISVLLMDYGTREPLCRLLFEARNSRSLSLETPDGLIGQGVINPTLELDLQRNADAAYSAALNRVAPRLH